MCIFFIPENSKVSMIPTKGDDTGIGNVRALILQSPPKLTMEIGKFNLE